MTELIESLLSGQAVNSFSQPMPSTSTFDHLSNQYHFTTFLADFRHFVSTHCEIKPHMNPTFFTWFFLGSLFNLPASGLMTNLGARDIFVKYKEGMIRIAFASLTSLSGTRPKIKLVFRTIWMPEARKMLEDPGTFSFDELKELAVLWNLDFFGLKQVEIDTKYVEFVVTKDPRTNQDINYDIVWKTHIQDKTPMVLEIVCKNKLTDEMFGRVFFQERPRFIKVTEVGNRDAVEDIKSLFQDLHRTNILAVQSSVDNLLARFYNTYRSYWPLVELMDTDIGMDVHSGYTTGIFVMNFKNRYQLSCKVIYSPLDESTLLTMLPQSTTNPRLTSNIIPIILTSVEFGSLPQSRMNELKQRGNREMLPSFETDSKLAILGVTNYDLMIEHHHVPITVNTVEINQGFLYKFLNVYNHFLQGHSDALHFLNLELVHMYHQLGRLDASLVSSYLFGQILSIPSIQSTYPLKPGTSSDDIRNVRKFVFDYENAVLSNEIKTFMISKGSNLIVCHVASEKNRHQLTDAFFRVEQINLFHLPDLNHENVMEISFLLDSIHGSYIAFKNTKVSELGQIPNAYSIHDGQVTNIGDINVPMLIDRMKQQQADYVKDALNRCLFEHKFLILDNLHLKFLLKGLFAPRMMTLTSLEKQSASMVIVLHQELPRFSIDYSLRELLAAPLPSDNVLRQNAPVIIKLNFMNMLRLEDTVATVKSAMFAFIVEYHATMEFPQGEEYPTLFSLIFNAAAEEKESLVSGTIWAPLDDSIFGSMARELFPAPVVSDCGKRRKRTIMNCLFSKSDLTKFTSSKPSTDSPKNTIFELDTDKFAEFCRHEGNKKKIKQLIEYSSLQQEIDEQLVIVGSRKNEFLKLVASSRTSLILNKVSKYSNLGTMGLIGKDILLNLFQGNFDQAAVTSSFILGSIALGMAPPVVNSLGLKLGLRGNKIGGVFLRASAPFIGKLASGYIIYDLLKNINMLNGENRDLAIAGIVGDTAFLVIDVLDVGIALSETFGVIEGVSSIFGPIGATVGALVFIGTNMYSTVRTVDKINKIIELTTTEKIAEGFRAFFSMSPEKHIQHLIERKERFNGLAKYAYDFLSNNTLVESYYFPTQYHDGGKWKDYANNYIDLNSHIPTNFLDRDQPNVPPGAELVCFDLTSEANFNMKINEPLGNITLLPENSKARDILNSQSAHIQHSKAPQSHLCSNAMGISKKPLSDGQTLVDLKHGNDYVHGYLSGSNIFIIGNGKKNVIGGHKGDIYRLVGNNTQGLLIGTQGTSNILDVSHYSLHSHSPLTINLLSPKQYFIHGYSYNSLHIEGMTSVIGRLDITDKVIVGCNTERIELQNGYNETDFDIIKVKDITCYYKMTIKLGSRSKVENHALFGEFNYLIETESPGRTIIHLSSNSKASHHFVFNTHIESLLVLRRAFAQNRITFVFRNEKFVTISGYEYTNCTFYFTHGSTQMQYSVDDKGSHFHAYVSLFEPQKIRTIVKLYKMVAQRLHVSFTVQSKSQNATIFISHANKHMKFDGSGVTPVNIMHNDPFHETYIYGSASENVYDILLGQSRLDSIKNAAVPHIHIIEDPLNNVTSTVILKGITDLLNRDLNYSVKLKIERNNGTDSLLLDILAVDPNNNDLEFCLTKIYFSNRQDFAWKQLSNEKIHIITGENPVRIVFNQMGQVYELQPIPLSISPEVKFLILCSAMVRKDMDFDTPRYITNYQFARANNSLILIEKQAIISQNIDVIPLINGPFVSPRQTSEPSEPYMWYETQNDANDGEHNSSDPFYVVLEDYFTEKSILSTLKFTFKNRRVDMAVENKHLGDIKSIDDLANEYENIFINGIDNFTKIFRA